MKVLVCGSSGCIGSAVARALRARGHQVLGAGRRGEGQGTTAGMRLDFMASVPPEAWAQRLKEAGVDAVVNCVGILMPRGGQTFERVHAQGPIELFQGAALAGVQRVVQVSALGAADGTSPYLASKRAADDALLALPRPGTVLRPTLVYGPGCDSSKLFATLASLPVVALPGGGGQVLRPIHVYEVAEIVTRCVEKPQPGVFDIGGADVVSYREMLATYRSAMGASEPLWLPLPMALMRLSAWAAEALPQQVFCRETVALLARGNVPVRNAAGDLLGRTPSTLATGLAVTPPAPWLHLHAAMSPAMHTLLRATLAFMWLWTAAVSAALPQQSGLLALLARCGFEGSAGWAMVVFSCTLNTVLGLLTLWRPGPRLYAAQCVAIVGYTLGAALNMPELTLDHCGPLVKNLPLLATVLLLWVATPAPAQPLTAAPRLRQARRPTAPPAA